MSVDLTRVSKNILPPGYQISCSRNQHQGKARLVGAHYACAGYLPWSSGVSAAEEFLPNTLGFGRIQAFRRSKPAKQPKVSK